MPALSPKRRKELKTQLRLWMDMGWPRWRINAACNEQLDINPETADELIQEIRHEQQQELTIERSEFMTQQLIRLEALATKAQEDALAHRAACPALMRTEWRLKASGRCLRSVVRH
jgi:hypothetical protein